jgi:hypothetical protein
MTTSSDMDISWVELLGLDRGGRVAGLSLGAILLT